MTVKRNGDSSKSKIKNKNNTRIIKKDNSTNYKKKQTHQHTKYNEKKAYIRVGIGILSLCIILMTSTFFIIPKLTLNINNKQSIKAHNIQKIDKFNDKPEKKESEQSDKAQKVAKKHKKDTPSVTHNNASNVPKEKKIAHKGTLIFVFDDAGHNLHQLQFFLDLPFPCTIAVLPRLANSVEAARRIRHANKEVILHQPMQSVDLNIDPGEGAIKPNIPLESVKQIVQQNIHEIAPIAGMNNHEGSLITEDKKLVRAVLEIVKKENIYFLDSRTTPKSVVPNIGKELGMVIWERAVFLDNDKDINAMKKEIKKGLTIAEKKGFAIMIGHVFTTELANLLSEMYPELQAAGFSLSTISEIATGKGKLF